MDARPKRPSPPRVETVGHSYLVIMSDRSHHLVGKDRICHTCGHGRCPSIGIVARYLRAGGARSPDPEPGATVQETIEADKRTYHRCWTWPKVCPICGAPTEQDRSMDHREHGAGWRCTVGGYTCLYTTRYWHLKSVMCRPVEDDAAPHLDDAAIEQVLTSTGAPAPEPVEMPALVALAFPPAPGLNYRRTG